MIKLSQHELMKLIEAGGDATKAVTVTSISFADNPTTLNFTYKGMDFSIPISHKKWLELFQSKPPTEIIQTPPKPRTQKKKRKNKLLELVEKGEADFVPSSRKIPIEGAIHKRRVTDEQGRKGWVIPK